MSDFLKYIQELKDDNIEFAVALNCKEIIVKIKAIKGDMVTLDEQTSNNRYDLHYTQIVICGSQE